MEERLEERGLPCCQWMTSDVVGKEKREAHFPNIFDNKPQRMPLQRIAEKNSYTVAIMRHISIHIATTVCYLYIYYDNPALMNVGAVDRLGCTSNGLNHNLLHHCWTATNMGGTIDTGRGNS